MADPGWYPDPGGAPNQYRYWNGTEWAAETSPTIDGPPPRSPNQAQLRRRRGLIIAIAAGALVTVGLIAALLVMNPFGQEVVSDPVDTSSPTGSAWDETTSPSATPTNVGESSSSNPASSGGSTVDCPQGNPASRQSDNVADKLTGGGISVDRVPTWGTPSTIELSFAYDVQAQTYSVATGWFNDVAVGALRFADGFDTPEQSAEIVMQCLASSDYYSGFESRTDVASTAVTVSGKPGWHLRAEIRVTGHEAQDIEGDVVDVVVVDPQRGEHLALYQASATMGRADIQGLVDVAQASLSVG